MKISVIHPTRNRNAQAYNTFRNWTEKASDWNNFEYILSIDYSDPHFPCYEEWAFSQTINRKIKMSANSTAIEAINNAVKIATGDILIVISDDFDCPEHWDTLLLKALEGKSDFCAKTNDGLQPTLITMPIMDRVYYERYGYVYHPDFLHMHCDEELTCVALMTGKYIKIDLLFTHNHYSTGRTEKDEINVKNDRTWAQGQRTIDLHARNNFGIENPVMQRKDIVWH